MMNRKKLLKQKELYNRKKLLSSFYNYYYFVLKQKETSTIGKICYNRKKLLQRKETTITERNYYNRQKLLQQNTLPQRNDEQKKGAATIWSQAIFWRTLTPVRPLMNLSSRLYQKWLKGPRVKPIMIMRPEIFTETWHVKAVVRYACLHAIHT